jgi:hypothetical protein
MSVINFTTDIPVASQTWGQKRNDMESRSIFGAQAAEVTGPLWVSSLAAPPQTEAGASLWQLLLLQLRGRTNQLALWCLRRPAPLGTMRGSMTLNADATQGDATLSIIEATQAGKTLLKGDLLGMGTATTQQVVMVTADATADGSGIISVNIEPPMRNTIAAAEAVTWDKPCVLFRRSNSDSNWEYQSRMVRGFTVDLIEDART